MNAQDQIMGMFWEVYKNDQKPISRRANQEMERFVAEGNGHGLAQKFGFGFDYTQGKMFVGMTPDDAHSLATGIPKERLRRATATA